MLRFGHSLLASFSRMLLWFPALSNLCDYEGARAQGCKQRLCHPTNCCKVGSPHPNQVLPLSAYSHTLSAPVVATTRCLRAAQSSLIWSSTKMQSRRLDRRLSLPFCRPIYLEHFQKCEQSSDATHFYGLVPRPVFVRVPTASHWQKKSYKIFILALRGCAQPNQVVYARAAWLISFYLLSHP